MLLLGCVLLKNHGLSIILHLMNYIHFSYKVLIINKMKKWNMIVAAMIQKQKVNIVIALPKILNNNFNCYKIKISFINV